MKIKFVVMAILLVGIVFSTLLFLKGVNPLVAGGEQEIISSTGLIFQRRVDNGKIDTDLFAVFGPQICTDYGDAFSPWASEYELGSYTYIYRIDIPFSYPSDILRVELFDPDSINNEEDIATITRTAAVQDPNIVDPALASQANKFCGIESPSGEQLDSCILPTNELEYLDAPLTMDQINPYWLMRVDSNRGQSPEFNGNGVCSRPVEYDSRLNTRTIFELYYYQVDGGGQLIRNGLATYTGQAGDDRDNIGRPAGSLPGDHHTDLNWVSPGAERQGPDFDAAHGLFHVPVDAGSTLDSFEIDLSSDVPGAVVDPETGQRSVYVDITAVSGASLNGFAIWAGPPDGTTTLPANVNQRNVMLVNNPTLHHSGGVRVTAVRGAAIETVADFETERPIAYLPAHFRGGTVTLSAFDLDSATQPPITFYIDTVPEEDWSVTFAPLDGSDDPDGVAAGVRCIPGNCDGEWIDPAYQITIPGMIEDCYLPDAPPEACVSFYGGTLMMRVNSAQGEVSTWEMNTNEPSASSNSASCTGYPIGMGSLIRSVTAPGTGATPYPDSSDFDYPPVPPTYSSFATHQPNILLDGDAPAGTIFKYELGSSSQSFSWLVWNQQIIPTDNTLSNSLIPPGNTTDFTDHGDAGTPHPDYGFVIRGYAEPGNVSDTDLQVENLVSKTFAQLSNDVMFGEVNQRMNDHISNDRLLLLPVYSETVTAVNAIVVEQFGLFKVVGYGNAGQANEWLLVEFVRWDDSCGQLVETPPTYENYLPWIAVEYAHD